MTRIYFIFLMTMSLSGYAQQQSVIDSLRKNYFSIQKTISNKFSGYYYPNRAKIYSLSEKQFLFKFDSFGTIFIESFIKYKEKSNNADVEFIIEEQ